MSPPAGTARPEEPGPDTPSETLPSQPEDEQVVDTVAALQAELEVQEAEAAAQSMAEARSHPPPTEKFIPVSRQEILRRMTRPGLWPGREAEAAARFFRYLAAWRHITYKERLEAIEDAYQPFSPETDVLERREFSVSERQMMKSRLLELVRRLLVQANYTEVPRTRLRELLTKESVYQLDLDVDFDEYEECIVFWRGATTKTRKRRALNKAYLGHTEIEFPIYQRLFVLLKLKPEEERTRELMAKHGLDAKEAGKLLKKKRGMLPAELTSDQIHIKLFKSIPRDDLEMLFPTTRVKFRLKDKLTLSMTAGGGTVATIAGVATKILAATNPVTLGMAALTLGGFAFRQASNVLNQRRAYLMILAQNLYFHTLADNRGAIALLAGRAEEEDLKEEMLVYTLLSRENVLESEIGEVKLAIEQFLADEFGVAVDFDVDDALSRLMADGIVRREASGRLKAMSPEEGSAHLDQAWDGYLDPKGEDRSLLAEGR
ncbi:MAG: TMEM143 family protein [Hyphomicrobiaceae bacterium]